MVLPKEMPWHCCQICKHEFLLKAHSGHCPICGCIAEQFMKQNLSFSADGLTLRNIRKART